MPPCSPGPTSAKRTCAEPDFAVRCWTWPTSAMQGWGVHSWSEPHSEVPICAVAIYAWRSSTAQISYANLDGAKGLTQAQLERAHLNNGTKLPAGLTGVENAER